jgi:valyl-tRNA synthetase
VKLPKVYEPQEYESTIYDLWEKGRAFVPKNRGGEGTFSIVIPPPNANGNLHLGHGLTLAVEDTLVRYHRLRGKAALLLPGADHAGFETQVVYEKELAKEGKSRFDFSREELYSHIYKFVAANKTNYESQFRRLGAGVDWGRFTFTLDDKVVKQAYQTFKKMWDEKLIYRGERLVNFCTFHGTAFSDIEVAYNEDAGKLWHIHYPLTDGSGEVVVATTRPETMLGDTAVAVHPDDPRYKKLLGRTIMLPLTNREIPIIADDMVDREFGTGAVKITPAHDFNDYELAQRHSLPMVTVIDFEGKLNADVPTEYRGLTVHEARKAVVAELKKQGYLKKTDSITHNVAHCYKCDTVLEPLLRDQWFVNMQPLVEPAVVALKANKITFYPANKKDQLIAYLEGLRDWNISRQIAWGIPIPAFQNVDNPDDWIFDGRVHEELLQIDNKVYRRDPDVFDTWFSSSSWPYATLNFPDGKDYDEFYPLSVMETGADIIYPWVSRMIMLGIYTTKKIPFESVYLHGLILDEHGAKMSKSKGNVIDPMQKIEQFGADAFRMGILAGQTAGNNQPYDETKVIGARNFANKLWNVARFVEEQLGDDAVLRTDPQPMSPADHWILYRLQQSTEAVSSFMDDFRLSEAYDEVYRLLWNDFADWYVEASKGELNPSVLAFGLESILKLAHPFAPFVTETIWQTIAWEKKSLLAVSSWPVIPKVEKNKVADFSEIQTVVTEIRAIMTSLKARDLSLFYQDSTLLYTYGPLIARLSRLKAVVPAEGEGKVEPAGGLRLTQTDISCWLNVHPDTAQAYINDLKGEAKQQEDIIAQLHKRLSNKAYVAQAPTKVVDQTRQQLAEAEQLLTNIASEIKRFSK